MKILNNILNVIIGSFIGVFIGSSIYVYWNFKTHPNVYAVQSAPWYTSILVYGIVTIVIVLIAAIIKILIKKNTK